MLRLKGPWPQQPRNDSNRARFDWAVLRPDRPLTGWAATGTPKLRGTNAGMGWQFGSGDYFTANAVVPFSNAVGNGPDWAVSVTFVPTSNAALDAIFSIADTATSAGPNLLFQNNSGTLRVFRGSYTNLFPLVVGAAYTVVITYSDVSPYPTRIFVNGILVYSTNAYQNTTDKVLFVGSGFPTQTVNSVILQATYGYGRGANNINVRGLSKDWKSLRPQRSIWVPISAGGGATTHDTTGALTAAGSAVAGTAAHIAKHATSGTLAGAGSTVAGSSARTRAHPASGALSGAGSAVAGSAVRERIHTTSGTLSGGAAVIAGSAARERVHPTSGALSGAGSAVVGSADHIVPGGTHETSGALQGAGSTVAGSAAHIAKHATSGALAGAGSAVAGTAARIAGAVTHATSGALVGQGASIDGVAVGPSSGVGDYGSRRKKVLKDIKRLNELVIRTEAAQDVAVQKVVAQAVDFDDDEEEELLSMMVSFLD